MSITLTIDEQLSKLEEDIRKLKIEFDIYFNGGTPRPPFDLKYRVQSLIKRLYDTKGMNFGQRFRYNSLVARFNVYNELWRRTIKDKEEGGRERDLPLLPDDQPVVASSDFSIATVRCADPSTEGERVRELYEYLVRARQSCGDSRQDLSFDKFQQIIETQVTQIRAKLHCDEIEFTVEVIDGLVKFKARAGS